MDAKTHNLRNNFILPIAIKQVKIIKYQGINNLSLAEINVDSQWVFVTGENGFGKTTFLQALTIGLFGTKDQNKDLLYEAKEANIIVEYKFGNQSYLNQTKSDE
ncbi:MAG: AAA family ATPase, partial [Saprospiraceae bacterium]